MYVCVCVMLYVGPCLEFFFSEDYLFEKYYIELKDNAIYNFTIINYDASHMLLCPVDGVVVEE